MTFANEHRILEETFQNRWADRTPIKFANIPYKPRQGVSYVEFKVLPGAVAQMTIGSPSNTHRHIGYISIDVYSPGGQGLSVIKGHVDAATAIFRSTTIASASVHCRSARYYDYGEDKGWYRLNIEVPFFRDENF